MQSDSAEASKGVDALHKNVLSRAGSWATQNADQGPRAECKADYRSHILGRGLQHCRPCMSITESLSIYQSLAVMPDAVHCGFSKLLAVLGAMIACVLCRQAWMQRLLS